MASANSNSNAKRCPQWRFPANAKDGAGVAHFSGCVCEELAKSKKACVCRPLAKPTGVPELDALVNDWLKWDMNDCTRNQIVDLSNKGNVPELTSRLSKRLSFGTAGLRAAMGAGFCFLNDLTIIQAAQGFLRYLRVAFPDDLSEKGIVIGYDGRHNSHRFALRTAAIFLHSRIRVYLFSEVVPTPWVSYAIRKLGACGGIMVTASHNPKNDNGYKVSWNNGSQIVCPHDLGIEDARNANMEPWSNSWDLEIATMDGDENATPGTPANIAFRYRSDPFPVIWQGYFADVKKEMAFNAPETNAAARKQLVHTSMHGVAHKFAKELFNSLGLPKFLYVWSQFETDGDFPELPFPNPEEGYEVLKKALQTADENKADVVVASDPDADRMGLAEKQSCGTWRIFTGNETASIFAWWIVKNMKSTEKGVEELPNCYILSSTVSTRLPATIARMEGLQFEETLTGFKWMGNRATQLDEMGHKVLFAFEEAVGFMTTPSFVVEKDGITAAGMIGEIYAYLEEEALREAQEEEERGSAEPAPVMDEEGGEEEKEKITWTLSGILDHIYTLYGYHLATTSYFICHDLVKIKAMFDRIRTLGADGKYPTACGPYEIRFIRDLTTGYDNSQANNLAILPVNKSIQMITVTFVNGCRATLRTSGTEPKVKYYAEMIGPPKTPPKEEAEEGVDGEDPSANANQSIGSASAAPAAEGEQEWNLENEKKRIRAELDDVIKHIVDEWFDL